MESVEAIRDKIVAFKAWKQRETFLERQSTEGMQTRARKNLKLVAPDQRGCMAWQKSRDQDRPSLELYPN